MNLKLVELSLEHANTWKELYESMPTQFAFARERLKFSHEEVLQNPESYLVKFIDACLVRGTQLPQKSFLALLDGKAVGNINLRLELNDFLRNAGGHIGYSVHPEYRNMSIATFMLREVCKMLPRFGLKRALITTDCSNIASQKVIQKCGATKVQSFQTQEVHKFRYWISALEFEMEHIEVEEKQSLNHAIENSLEFLNSESASRSLEADPYWPKWSNPWWHLTFLMELGLMHLVPQEIIDKYTLQINAHYLKFFPIRESECPPQCSPYHDIICHCALGTAMSVLFEWGKNPLEEFPWAAEWMEKSALPQGGYNCDSDAYLGSGSASFVSNTAILEACTQLNSIGLGKEFQAQAQFCANWLADRNYYQRKTTKQIADKEFLFLQFPRAYEYNALRGYLATLEWNVRNSQTTKTSNLFEVMGWKTPNSLSEKTTVLPKTHKRETKFEKRPSLQNTLLEAASQKSVAQFFHSIEKSRMNLLETEMSLMNFH
jgi:predicted acetyltransferase